MAKTYVFYNPFAGNGDYKKRLDELRKMIPDELIFCDLTKEETYESSLFKLTAEDFLILCGGDGTLNRFVNITEGIHLPCEIFYYPIGRNNDFARDLGKKNGDKPFNITSYLRELPIAEIKNRDYRFLNGICCGSLSAYFQEACKKHEDHLKRTNHSIRVTIRKLLFHGSPADIRVTVDGILHFYQQVWLVLTMNGKFYGGMMPTPDQNRENSEKLLSIMVLHNSSKCKAWGVFPSLFTGNHMRHQDVIEILSGRDIRVEFDQPVVLGIDGNMISDVDFYGAAIHSIVPV